MMNNTQNILAATRCKIWFFSLPFFAYILAAVLLLFFFGACSQKKILKVEDPFAYSKFEKTHKKKMSKEFVSFYQKEVEPQIQTSIKPDFIQSQNNLLDSVASPYSSAMVVLADVDAQGKVQKAEFVTEGSDEEKTRVLALVKSLKMKPALLGGNSYPSKIYIRFLR